MGVTLEEVSRWENGHRPIGAQSERFLRLMVLNMEQVQDYPITNFDELEDRPAPKKELRFRKKTDQEWRRSTVQAVAQAV